jgi:hypothetical protein
MNLLKQSTAVILKLGPFVDDTDGKTAETGLTIAQADIQISKAGAAFAQTSETSPTTTHDADGWYPIPLTASDTDTLGRIVVQVAMSGALPVWWEGMVVPVAVYDSLVAGTDKLPVDAVEISGSSTAADNVEANIANLDAAVSSRSTLAAGAQMDLVDAPNATAVTAIQSGLSTLTAQQVWEYSTRTLSNFGTLVADIWGALLTGISTVGSIGKLIKDNLDAAVSSRSTYAGADTAGTTTLLDRLTAARAGYLDKLNVSGTLAHSDAADTYKADVSGLANDIKAAMEAEGSALDKIQAAVYDSATRSGTTITLSNGATQVVDSNGRTTTEP